MFHGNVRTLELCENSVDLRIAFYNHYLYELFFLILYTVDPDSRYDCPEHCVIILAESQSKSI